MSPPQQPDGDRPSLDDLRTAAKHLLPAMEQLVAERQADREYMDALVQASDVLVHAAADVVAALPNVSDYTVSEQVYMTDALLSRYLTTHRVILTGYF